VPWAALAVLAVATVLVALPGGGARIAARVLALLVLAASAYGVVDHVLVNYGSAVLDQRYADTWNSLPALTRWWYAASKQVGQAPTLAPGVLGQAAVLLLLATVGGPLRSRARDRSGSAHRTVEGPAGHRGQAFRPWVPAARRRQAVFDGNHVPRRGEGVHADQGFHDHSGGHRS
jgi:hypothetical protein